MSAWTWVLVGLCAAGLFLAVGSAIPVVTSAARLSRRVNAFKQSNLALSLQSLQIQGDRLGRLSTQAQPLLLRARVAVVSIRTSLEALRTDRAHETLASTGAELEALRRDLE